MTQTKTQQILVVFLVCCAIATLFGGLASTVNADLSSGLVGYWKFDDGVGTNAFDSSENGNNATLTDCSWVNGKFDEALNFNGASSLGTIASNSVLNALTSAVTVSFWVNGSANTPRMYPFSSDIMGFSFYDGDTNGVLIINIGGENRFYSFGEIPINSFNLITVTFNGVVCSLYLNGDIVGFHDQVGFLLPFGDTYIGAAGGWHYWFNGTIDDLRIYDHALSSGEVADLYAFDPSATPAPSPTSTATANPTIIDSTTIGLDITIYLFILIFLTASAIIAFKYWPLLGGITGIIGGVLSYLVFTSTVLILNSTYDQANHAYVYQTYPLGFLVWIPVVLTALNFVLVLKAK